MLRFFFTWRVCLGGGLFINFITDTSSTYSIQDQGWNIDTQQISDMVAPIRSPSEPLLLGNVIPDSSPGGLVALAIPVDGSSSDSKFAIQTPPKQGSDIANQDGILVQGGDSGSGCPSSDNTRSTSYPRSSRKKIRARNDKKMCPKNFLLPRPPPPKSPNGGEEGGEQDRRTRPQLSLPKEDEQKKNSGDSGGRNGDRDPSEPPAIMIPPDDSKLPYLFMPEENRPKRNPELCTDPMHPVPVCGRPSDTYPLPHTYPNNQFNIDPCYPYVVLVGCISVEGGRMEYCCSRAEVAYAYDGLRDGETELWQEVLAGEGEMLWEIQKALMAGLHNPFKLVGIACISMGTTRMGGEGGAPTPF